MADPIPTGYEGITPYLIVPNSIQAIKIYQKAFDAETVMILPGPVEGTTMHAEIKVFDNMVMLSDENPQWGCSAPNTIGGTAVSLHVYVEDVNTAFQKALDAGFTEAMPLMDAFWGDRFGKLKDPFGHEWSLATHTVDLSPEEIKAGAQKFYENM